MLKCCNICAKVNKLSFYYFRALIKLLQEFVSQEGSHTRKDLDLVQKVNKNNVIGRGPHSPFQLFPFPLSFIPLFTFHIFYLYLCRVYGSCVDLYRTSSTI